MIRSCALTNEDFEIWDRILNPSQCESRISGWGYHLMSIRDAEVMSLAVWHRSTARVCVHKEIVNVRSNVTALRREGLLK